MNSKSLKIWFTERHSQSVQTQNHVQTGPEEFTILYKDHRCTKQNTPVFVFPQTKQQTAHRAFHCAPAIFTSCKIPVSRSLALTLSLFPCSLSPSLTLSPPRSLSLPLAHSLTFSPPLSLFLPLAHCFSSLLTFSPITLPHCLLLPLPCSNSPRSHSPLLSPLHSLSLSTFTSFSTSFSLLLSPCAFCLAFSLCPSLSHSPPSLSPLLSL